MQLKDTIRESQAFMNRTIVAGLLVVFAVSLLTWRMLQLQVVDLRIQFHLVPVEEAAQVGIALAAGALDQAFNLGVVDADQLQGARRVERLLGGGHDLLAGPQHEAADAQPRRVPVAADPLGRVKGVGKAEIARRVRDGRANHDHVAARLNTSPWLSVPDPLGPEARAPDSIQFNLCGMDDSDTLAFAVDQYLLGGGNLIVFANPATGALIEDLRSHEFRGLKREEDVDRSQSVTPHTGRKLDHAIIVALGLVLFAFTTVLGWSVYGERCVVFLFGARAILPFRILWVAAIPMGDRTEEANGRRWVIDDETCFRYWNVVGTDCATYMKVCPYSHPDNWMHNLVRWALRISPGTRSLMLRADDLVYGRKP